MTFYIQSSLGTNSSMFANCSVFCDVRHVRSSVLGQNVMFEVQSGCYVTRLVLEHTVWCSQTIQFFVMFDMFENRFWAKIWCLESSMFGYSMFGVFEVWYFGVRSKTRPDVCTFCSKSAHSVLCNWVACPLRFCFIKGQLGAFIYYRLSYPNSISSSS